MSHSAMTGTDIEVIHDALHKLRLTDDDDDDDELPALSADERRAWTVKHREDILALCGDEVLSVLRLDETRLEVRRLEDVVIGSGGFSDVFAAELIETQHTHAHTSTNTQTHTHTKRNKASHTRTHTHIAAVKILHIDDRPADAPHTRAREHLTWSEAENEALLLRFLSPRERPHPHILHAYGIVEDPLQLQLCLFLPLAPYGSLSELVRDKECFPRIPLSLSLSWLCDIAHTLAFIHAHGVLYRDLNPENVLLFPGLRIKLCDFGLSLVSPRVSCGTRDYMAWEERESERERETRTAAYLKECVGKCACVCSCDCACVSVSECVRVCKRVRDDDRLPVRGCECVCDCACTHAERRLSLAAERGFSSAVDIFAFAVTAVRVLSRQWRKFRTPEEVRALVDEAVRTAESDLYTHTHTEANCVRTCDPEGTFVHTHMHTHMQKRVSEKECTLRRPLSLPTYLCGSDVCCEKATDTDTTTADSLSQNNTSDSSHTTQSLSFLSAVAAVLRACVRFEDELPPLYGRPTAAQLADTLSVWQREMGGDPRDRRVGRRVPGQSQTHTQQTTSTHANTHALVRRKHKYVQRDRAVVRVMECTACEVSSHCLPQITHSLFPHGCPVCHRQAHKQTETEKKP